jgi:energy-coupling factor transporter ATP-binding protein EcfA2
MDPASPSGALYFLTGSSGAGKTTLLRRVTADVYPTLSAWHIDDFGVPAAEELASAGGGWAWQALQTRRWAARAVRERAFIVVEGQARPTDIFAAAAAEGLRSVHVTLIDCAHAVRRRRLIGERAQPELDTLDMYAWAAYLRGQADALSLEVIDTAGVTVDVSSAALAASIARFAELLGVVL